MGLSDYLKDIGIGSSFIDLDEQKARGQKQSMWQLLTRALLNNQSFEFKILEDNLDEKKKETQKYQIDKQNRESRLKKK